MPFTYAQPCMNLLFASEKRLMREAIYPYLLGIDHAAGSRSSGYIIRSGADICAGLAAGKLKVSVISGQYVLGEGEYILVHR
jgi:hypothetical protein